MLQLLKHTISWGGLISRGFFITTALGCDIFCIYTRCHKWYAKLGCVSSEAVSRFTQVNSSLQCNFQ